MFSDFSKIVHATFGRMAGVELFKVDTSDLFEVYLSAFPEGTNPIFRERTEHDCSCCKNFIRNIGNVVAIIDGRVVTVWDDYASAPAPYDVVGRVLAERVRQAPIRGVWRTKERQYSQETSVEMMGDRAHTWHHFAARVPDKNFSLTPDKAAGDINTTAHVLRRGLNEITLDALDTVIDLAEANNLLRGTEFLPAIKGFRALRAQWTGDELLIWQNLDDRSARFRNTAIGTLLLELSAGEELEKAVGKYENMVSGTNYKRPTALVTPKMIEAAVTKIDELGLRGSVERRHARIEDLSINDVLFVDNASASQMRDSLADTLMASASRPVASVKNPQPISAEDFFTKSYTSISALVENRHGPNFMSLTAPVDTTEGRLFSWNNDFSWSYDGDVADSIKQRVKAAGGNVDAKFRVSLAWFNTDDLDLHCYTPGGRHVYFGSKQGILDVDANGPSVTNRRDPVENMAFTSVEDGTYRFDVHQYSRRNSHDVGFTLEIQIGAQIMQYSYAPMVVGTVKAISITLQGGQFVDMVLHTDLTGGGFSAEKWGVSTEQLVPVETLMLSPNFWNGQTVGNKHWFFILRGCKNPDPVRGIYNEYLRPDLNEHRKVFEVLGSKTKAPFAEDQLSGLGFSSTQRNTLTVVADGRAYEIQF
jgi:hypothetical protein